MDDRARGVATPCIIFFGELLYDTQRHDLYGYWDITPQFLDRLNTLLSLNRQTPVQIKAPFVGYTKAEIVRLGLELEIDYGKTWSCYQGGDLWPLSHLRRTAQSLC